MFQQKAAKKEEARRRAVLEGSLRLEKVSSEVERMERVVGAVRSQQEERTETVSKDARVVESSLGERSELMDGRDHVGNGKESSGLTGDSYSQGQGGGMAVSQHG